MNSSCLYSQEARCCGFAISLGRSTTSLLSAELPSSSWACEGSKRAHCSRQQQIYKHQERVKMLPRASQETQMFQRPQIPPYFASTNQRIVDVSPTPKEAVMEASKRVQLDLTRMQSDKNEMLARPHLVLIGSDYCPLVGYDNSRIYSVVLILLFVQREYIQSLLAPRWTHYIREKYGRLDAPSSSSAQIDILVWDFVALQSTHFHFNLHYCVTAVSGYQCRLPMII